MSPEKAQEILGLASGTDSEAVMARYVELHGEYQVRLTNAPTAALKSTYQRQLEELREAAETLAPELVVQGNADLPAATPVVSAENLHPRQVAVASDDVRPAPRTRWAKPIALAIGGLVVVGLGMYAIAKLKSPSQPEQSGATVSLTPSTPQSKLAIGTLLIIADMPSQVQLDGQDIGDATPELPLRHEVEAEKEHFVRVVPRSGSGAWTRTVSVPAGGQRVVAPTQHQPAPSPSPPTKMPQRVSAPDLLDVLNEQAPITRAVFSDDFAAIQGRNGFSVFDRRSVSLLGRKGGTSARNIALGTNEVAIAIFNMRGLTFYTKDLSELSNMEPASLLQATSLDVSGKTVLRLVQNQLYAAKLKDNRIYEFDETGKLWNEYRLYEPEEAGLVDFVLYNDFFCVVNPRGEGEPWLRQIAPDASNATFSVIASALPFTPYDKDDTAGPNRIEWSKENNLVVADPSQRRMILYEYDPTGLRLLKRYYVDVTGYYTQLVASQLPEFVIVLQNSTLQRLHCVQF